MALNVTTAAFQPGCNRAAASPSLVQWDQGQILQFEGVELPLAYQVEFSNAVTVQAIPRIGGPDGVEIPNELLQQSYPITAYIVLHETAEDRETEYWATIYVKARQRPQEVLPDPEETSVIDQTIAALQEGVAEAQAASQAVQNMGVEAETLPEGSAATVEKTVDPETGEVTLEFGIPEGRHGATGATPDIQIGTVTTGAPGSQADASITGTREEPRLNLTIPQGPQGDAGVTSVNGKTGAVTLDASDVGAKPASYEAPVSSVNGKTGAVVLDASDVGAKPASYEAPVSSVNEKTGAVVLDSEDIRYDSTETYSDGTVGKELGTINSALTSLQSVTEIIDTASGAIASFPDGSGLPMRSLVAQINPVQDLHGYENPWPAGGGKNKFNVNAITSAEGITVSNGSLVITAPSGRDNTTTENALSDFADLVVGQQYTLTFTTTYSGGNYIYLRGTSEAWSNGASKTVTQAMLDGKVSFYSGVGETATISDLMIRLATETDATFAPYENVCPISGWTGLQGQRTGVNVFGGEALANVIMEKVEGATIDTVNKTVTFTASKIRNIVLFDKFKPNTQYTIFCKNTGASNIDLVYTDGTKIGVTSNGVTVSNPSKSGIFGLVGSWHTGNTTLYYEDFGVIEGALTADDFVPYTGDAISVSFGQTVYGGFDEVVSGNGTSTMGMVDLGTLTWSYNGAIFSAAVSGIVVPATTADRDKGIISSVYPVSTNLSISASMDDKSMLTGSGNIYIRDTSYTTAADFKTAMNGVQLCYQLATPQSFTHSGQAVSTVYSTNNVWVDTGSVEVTYPADTKLYIDKKIAEALA